MLLTNRRQPRLPARRRHRPETPFEEFAPPRGVEPWALWPPSRAYRKCSETRSADHLHQHPRAGPHPAGAAGPPLRRV